MNKLPNELQAAIHTNGFPNLDQGCKMIIFESLWTTFIMTAVFKGFWRRSKNWLELKIKPPLANLPKSVKQIVVTSLSKFRLRNGAFLLFLYTPKSSINISIFQKERKKYNHIICLETSSSSFN